MRPTTIFTINAPAPLVSALKTAAAREHLTLQAYCVRALARFLERYEHAPERVPEPLLRPSPQHPNLTIRAPEEYRQRLHALRRELQALRDAGQRGEGATLAALLLAAYRQALTAPG